MQPKKDVSLQKQKIRSFLWYLPLVIFLFSCALLSPPTLIIPSPIPPPSPLPGTPPTSSGPPSLANSVINPVSDVYPDLDPDIEVLVNAVSEQQLVAYVQKMESFRTRNSFSATDQENIGIGAARRWINQEMVRVGQASNGRLIVQNYSFELNYRGLSARQENVVAILPGTDPNAGAIVIMGHYDSRPPSEIDGLTTSPGANDNGSGIALILESIRLLSARTWNQTIIFAALAAEEQGTVGSRELVRRLLDDGHNIISAINYDSVGGRSNIPYSVRLFAHDLESSQSGAIGRYFAFMGRLYIPKFPIILIDALDREARWGDHREFVYAGIPAVRVIESVEDPNLINSRLDTWEIIDYAYLKQVTQLNVAVIANMAGSPPPPLPPTIVNMATPGSFSLVWQRNPNAEGYAIAFRDSNSDIRNYPILRFVNSTEAGNVVLTGYDPSRTYYVSISAIDEQGRMSLFSSPVLIEPSS